MKIAFIINDLESGGAERVVSTLSHYFSEGRGHEICIITIRKSQDDYDLPASAKRYALRSGCLSRGPGKLLFMPVFAMELAILLRRLKVGAAMSLLVRPNLIHIMSAWAGNRLPINISERTITLSEYSGTSMRSVFMKALISRLYNRAERILAISKGVKKSLGTLGVSPERVTVVYNPQDLEKIREKIAEVPAIPYAFDKPTLVTVGRLSDEKDHRTLLETLTQVRKKVDANLIVMGKGPKEEELRRLTLELGLEGAVFWVGFQENPFSIMAKCDLFVLTSKYEGFGNVLVEAMACGLPVVSMDCPGGPREILSDGEYGILVPPGRSDILANEILKLLEDGNLRSEWKSKGMERASSFDVDAIAAQYLDILTDGNRVRSGEERI